MGAESPEIAKLQAGYRLFVDGTFAEGGGRPLTVINPASGKALTEVSTASSADVDTAVRAARRAYDKVWSKMAGAERAKYLFRIARLIQERARELAVLESLDTGRPVRQSRDALVPAAAAHFFHHAGWADKLGYAGYGPDPRPLGVTGQIIGPDAALRSAAWKIAPALACGNTVVLKPAETTPLTALVLAGICQQAELPPGVVNVLPGAGDVGAALVAHDSVAKVTFTGSPEVGRQIRRALAGTGRRLTLSLGGSVTTIVFDDAPLDRVADGIVGGVLTGGAGSRLVVAEPVAQHLLATLHTGAATLRIGDPLDDDTDLGAVGSGSRLARIRDLCASADAEGAQRWTSPAPLPEHGFYLCPTVFSEVGPTMRIARAQLVGPVLAMLTFRTPEEAAALVESTSDGLATAVWTTRASRLAWAARRLRAGVMWMNSAARFDPTAPFGHGQAGTGRDGGRLGLAAYLDV